VDINHAYGIWCLMPLSTIFNLIDGENSGGNYKPTARY
jgi:hypothetical protein